MEWYFYFGVIEYTLIGLFSLGILLYWFRLWRVGSQLKQGFFGAYLKILLRITYFVLLIIALLGPSFGYGKKTIQTVGKDIYIAVDLSESMNAEDIPPTRLEKIKFELKNLVDQLPTDRIGLIIFSSEAFLQTPLTYDKSALHLFIQTLGTKLVPTRSTDFYPPLRLALDKHLEIKQSGTENLYAKVVLLVTDGEDFGEDTEDILDEMVSKGIRLFTLGVGTRQGGKIVTPQGIYKKDKEGKDVVSKLNYQTLMRLAEKTDGMFFEISNDKNEMPQLIAEIQAIKGQKMDVRTVDVSSNKYVYFVWVALGLIIFDVLLTIRVFRI